MVKKDCRPSESAQPLAARPPHYSEGRRQARPAPASRIATDPVFVPGSEKIVKRSCRPSASAQPLAARSPPLFGGPTPGQASPGLQKRHRPSLRPRLRRNCEKSYRRRSVQTPARSRKRCERKLMHLFHNLGERGLSFQSLKIPTCQI